MAKRQKPESGNHPVTYTRERVVDAAFELIRESGWQSVSARAIAERLGSSTMPIYSHLRSIAEVERALREKARHLLRDYQTRQWTPDPLMDMAFGYIAFARDERHLFRFLYLERPDVVDEETLGKLSDSLDEQFGPDSAQATALAQLDASAHGALVTHTWIFTHGLAVLVSSGALGECSDETILGFLGNAGEAFYLWAAGRSGAEPPANGGTDDEG